MPASSRSKLKQIPIYILAALSLLSALTRAYDILSNGIKLTSPLSKLSETQKFLQKLRIFPSPSTASLSTSDLYAMAMDALLSFLIMYPRTRFLACGTVLVLLGMSTGNTMRANRELSPGDYNQGLAFEVAMFKMMIANLATLSSWSESGLAVWWTRNDDDDNGGQRNKADQGNVVSRRSDGKITASVRRRDDGMSTVHQRLR